MGLLPERVRGAALVLWRPRERLRQHDVGRVGLQYPEVGGEPQPHLLDASVTGGHLPVQAARPSRVDVSVKSVSQENLVVVNSLERL